MNKLHAKKGDTVVILSGKDKGKQGKVIEALPKAQKVIVEGINIVKKHQKPRRQGEVGGIIEMNAAIYACKVMNVCTKCKKPTRPSFKVEGDKKTRVCKHCGAAL